LMPAAQISNQADRPGNICTLRHDRWLRRARSAVLRGCRLDAFRSLAVQIWVFCAPMGRRGQRLLVSFLGPARQVLVLERTSDDDRELECVRQLGIRGGKPGELRCVRRWPAVVAGPAVGLRRAG
jgi:hypothetical protein